MTHGSTPASVVARRIAALLDHGQTEAAREVFLDYALGTSRHVEGLHSTCDHAAHSAPNTSRQAVEHHTAPITHQTEGTSQA